MFIYLFDGFLRREFSLLRADGILIYAYSSGLRALSSSCPRFYFAFFTRSLVRDSPHLFTTTSVPKLIFFIPISADGRSSHFRLRVLPNHLASIFFLPLSGDSLGQLSLWPGHRVQTSVGFHSISSRPRDNSNTWNHLTSCKRIRLGSFKNFINKMC